MRNHRLAPCPSSPNCVCTLGNSQSHVMPPYRYRNTLEEAKVGLKQVFSEMSRTELIEEEDVYLHDEVTSLLARFVDDVEILIDDATKEHSFPVGRTDWLLRFWRKSEMNGGSSKATGPSRLVRWK